MIQRTLPKPATVPVPWTVRRVMILVLTVAFASALALAAPESARARDTEAVSVTAAVEKEAVSLGEPFLLQIQVEGADQPSGASGGAGPDMGAVVDFSVESLGSRSNSSSSISIINGKMSRVETHGYVYTYRLTPRKVGQLTIPAVPVVVASQTHFTQPVRVRVAQPQTSDDFLLRVEYSKTRLYVGEPIIVTVTWYLGKDVESGSFQLPVFEDDAFTVSDPKVEQDPNRQYYQIPLKGGAVLGERGRDVIDHREYTTISFRKILFGVQPGVFDIPEATISCKALVGYARKHKRRSPLDGFFDDDFFSMGRKGVYKTFVARSGPATLTVLPLPEEGRPADFSGAVGSFRIESSAAPTDVSVGDPITLTTTISSTTTTTTTTTTAGSDLLEKVELPPLSQNPDLARDFRIPEEMAAGTVQDGVKIFTQTLRANSDTVKSIPPIRLVYFDPDLGQYREVASRPIPLQVKPTRVVTADDIEGRIQPARAKNELEAWSQGIAYNYEGPEVLENRGFRLSSAMISPFWLAGLILPFSSFLVLLFVTRQRARKTADPHEYRSRKALASFKRSLKRYAASPAARDGSACDGLLCVVRSYLGDKLKIQGDALTFIDTERHLRERGVDLETIARLGELFSHCEQGRYSGGSAGPAKSVDVLRQEAMDLVAALDRKMGS